MRIKVGNKQVVKQRNYEKFINTNFSSLHYLQLNIQQLNIQYPKNYKKTTTKNQTKKIAKQKKKHTVNWDFLQTPKQVYSYLQHGKKILVGFKLSLEKMVLYSLFKIGIIKPWINIPWLRRFDLGFWQTSK